MNKNTWYELVIYQSQYTPTILVVIVVLHLIGHVRA